MVDSRDRNTSALLALDLETRESEVIYANDRADVSANEIARTILLRMRKQHRGTQHLSQRTPLRLRRPW